MLFRLKPLAIATCCIIFCMWWFGVNNQSIEDTIYPKSDYVQDLSKIYFDLGQFAEKRNDFHTASIHYKKALDVNPKLTEAQERLHLCFAMTKQDSPAHIAA
jgi:hypothetical protein